MRQLITWKNATRLVALVSFLATPYILYLGWQGDERWELILAILGFITTAAISIISFVGSFFVSDKPIFKGDHVARDKYVGGTHISGGNVQIVQGSLAPLTPAERHNRANLIANVRQTWIDGYLKQSLYTGVRLELGKASDPSAVSRPWSMVLHKEGAEPEPIPDDQTILNVYRQCGANLLILGEPGSGKTMTLLMLAEALLDEAEADEGQPVPVVLNLSSWALQTEAAPLRDWLVTSLSQQYQLSKLYADELLTQQRVTLLLDGLDEVAAEKRAACAEAINAFKAEQMMSVVVCSRVANYEKLGQKLNLSHAIRLQPLSHAQIEAYLADYDPNLQALWTALPQDEALRKLAKTPLMLAVMTLAYQGAKPEELATHSTPDERRAHIFDRYIEKMFARRPLQGDYDQQQAHHWLSQLAFQMFVHSQSIYYIELMQPTWLPTQKLINHFQFVNVLIFVLPFGIVSGFFLGLFFGLLIGLLSGLSTMLLLGLIIQSGYYREQILLKEILHFTKYNTHIIKFIVTLGMTVCAIFICVLLLRIDLIVALLALLLFLLAVRFFVEVVAEVQPIRDRQQANQGIHSTLKTSLIYGLTNGLLFGLLFGLVSSILTDKTSPSLLTGLIGGLPSGLLFGLLGAFRGGGEAISQHYVLRWLLARQNVLPYWYRDKKLVAFLDDMVAHIFLRRVGGGWVFIHRSLLEHFAAKVDVAALGWENWSGTLRDPAELRADPQKEADGSPER